MSSFALYIRIVSMASCKNARKYEIYVFDKIALDLSSQKIDLTDDLQRLEKNPGWDCQKIVEN